MAAANLNITDGTTTVDFIGDAAYHVVRWAPAVAKRSRGTMLGQNVYDDVMEEMELTISGASALDKLAKLVKLMDQVEKWARGERRTGAYIYYNPVSTGSSKIAVITGDTEVVLPENFVLSPDVQMIDPVILRFRRRGVWLKSALDNASSSAVAHPAVASITGLTAVDADSPLDISIGSMAQFGGWGYPWYILRARAAADLVILKAEDLATGGVFTSVDDSANDAKDTNVLRYTPGSTAWLSPATPITGFTMNGDGQKWGVFINYHNNSTTTTFQVKINLCGTETPIFYVPAGAGPPPPRWVFAGVVSIPLSATASIFLSVKASAAAGSIDFDSIALILLDTPVSGQVLEIIGGDGEDEADSAFEIKHNLDNFLLPQIYRGTTPRFLTYTGSPIFWLPAGDTSLVMALLATDGAKWVPCTNAGTPYSTAFTVYQDGGYLTVE